MITRLNLPLLTVTCVTYTLIFNSLSFMNFGRSPSALQTVAFPKVATISAALITLIAVRLALFSKNSLGIMEQDLVDFINARFRG